MIRFLNDVASVIYDLLEPIAYFIAGVLLVGVPLLVIATFF